MNSSFSDPAFWSRFQFGFTLTYHYLFPQLTMGLAWFLVYWKWRALKTGDEKYNRAARFWAKIFGLNFAIGVVTGIPMEFQFGTNWAGFSRYAGGTIGQTLAMEGMFAFFLESAFVGALLWGEKRLGPRYHFLAAVAVAFGSWLSGYFIVNTNSFMQHPVGYQSRFPRLTWHRKSSRLFTPSVGANPIFTQSNGSARNRLVRNSSDWGVLCLAATPSRTSSALSSCGHVDRTHRVPSCGISHG